MKNTLRLNAAAVVIALLAVGCVDVLAQVHSLSEGWNLVGNDTGVDIDPIAVFGNPLTTTSVTGSIVTVWAWDPDQARWAFFAPSMAPAQLASYAEAKGYGVLTAIPRGRGFWANTSAPVTVNLNGTAAASASHSLAAGWNLVANDAGATVDPVTVFGTSDAPTGISSSLLTIWTWNAASATWNFFAPSMTASAVGSYAAEKGYGIMNAMQKGEGFWANAVNAVTVDLATGAGTGGPTGSGTATTFCTLRASDGSFWMLGRVDSSHFSVSVQVLNPGEYYLSSLRIAQGEGTGEIVADDRGSAEQFLYPADTYFDGGDLDPGVTTLLAVVTVPAWFKAGAFDFSNINNGQISCTW